MRQLIAQLSVRHQDHDWPLLAALEKVPKLLSAAEWVDGYRRYVQHTQH